MATRFDGIDLTLEEDDVTAGGKRRRSGEYGEREKSSRIADLEKKKVDDEWRAKVEKAEAVQMKLFSKLEAMERRATISAGPTFGPKKQRSRGSVAGPMPQSPLGGLSDLSMGRLELEALQCMHVAVLA